MTTALEAGVLGRPHLPLCSHRAPDPRAPSPRALLAVTRNAPGTRCLRAWAQNTPSLLAGLPRRAAHPVLSFLVSFTRCSLNVLHAASLLAVASLPLTLRTLHLFNPVLPHPYFLWHLSGSNVLHNLLLYSVYYSLSPTPCENGHSSGARSLSVLSTDAFPAPVTVPCTE